MLVVVVETEEEWSHLVVRPFFLKRVWVASLTPLTTMEGTSYRLTSNGKFFCHSFLAHPIGGTQHERTFATELAPFLPHLDVGLTPELYRSLNRAITAETTERIFWKGVAFGHLERVTAAPDQGWVAK